MTSIADAWGGAPFSQPIVNNVQPRAANDLSQTQSEREVRAQVTAYIEKQHALFGASGVVALLRPSAVEGVRNYALTHTQYWSDADVALVLALGAILLVLCDDD